jgi:F0F1-type ATP synthase membrane subunit b/b'
MFDAGFWLLVAFLIFFSLVFSKVKSVISNAIIKYKSNVVDTIESAEKSREASYKELQKMQNKTTEVEETCRKIVNSAIIEADRFENDAKNQITSYLHFKEKYIQEKIKIFTSVRTQELKKSVVEGALQLVHQYLNEKSKAEKLDLTELKRLTSRENLLINK